MSVLCIVAVSRPEVIEQARHALASIPNVEIIVDRRLSQAPLNAALPLRERRYRRIDERLRAQGYAIVSTGDGAA
ncbi:MAG TPA: hypothetical protein VFJ24_04795 [Gaiellales bacterium]|nr:hypothetical protein [Gaiellales bacterium]